MKFSRLHPSAILPSRKHPTDAGLDLYALHPALIAPHGIFIVPTGITLEIPPGYVGLLKPKGRSDHLIGAGVIDAGYQGEILVKVFNPTDNPLVFKAGEAIAQLLILPVQTPEVEEVPPDQIHTQSSSRGGTGGIVDQSFGSPPSDKSL